MHHIYTFSKANNPKLETMYFKTYIKHISICKYTHVCLALEARRVHWIHWNWSYGPL